MEPPTRHRLRRRALQLALSGLVATVLIALAVWWKLPQLTKLVLARAGITCASAGREANGRLRFDRLDAVFGDAQVRADRLELPALFDLIRLRFGQADPARSNDFHLTVQGWSLAVAASTAEPEAEPMSALEVWEMAETGVDQLQRWLPFGRLEDGIISVAGTRLTVGQLAWDPSGVRFDSRVEDREIELEGQVDFLEAGAGRVHLQQRGQPLAVEALFSRSDGEWEADGELTWRTNSVHFDARFRGDSLIPYAATVTADSFALPMADLTGFAGLPDALARARFQWDGERYQFRVSADSIGPPGALPNLSELHASISGWGDLERVTLETLEANAPGLRAHLANPLTLNRTMELLSSATSLEMDLDLAQLSRWAAVGRLNGTAHFRANDDGPIIADLDLRGESIALAGISLTSLAAAGELSWPVLRLTRLEANHRNGFHVQATGRLNVVDQVLQDLEWRLSGQMPPGLLPKAVDPGAFEAVGTASGTLDDIRHTGSLTAPQIRVAGLKPLALETAWRGQSNRLDPLHLDLASGRSRLTLESTVTLSPTLDEVAVTVSSLEWTREEIPQLTLVQPVDARLDRRAAAGSDPLASVSLSRLAFTGPGGSIEAFGEMAWPRRGQGELHVTNLTTGLLEDWLAQPVPPLAVHSLDSQMRWDGGPLAMEATFDIESLASEWPGPLRLRGSLRQDGDYLRLAALNLERGDAPLLAGSGSLPLTIRPLNTPALTIDREAPIEGGVSLTPAAVREILEHTTAITLEEGSMEARLAGTLNAPNLSVTARATDLKLPASLGFTNLPPIGRFALDAAISPSNLEIRRLELVVLDQPLKIQGVLPFASVPPDQLWTRPPQPRWAEATGRLRTGRIGLDRLSQEMPSVLLPLGEIEADVRLLAGPRLEGLIVVTNAATAPVVPMGSVRDIHARVVFTNDTAIIEQAVAHLGGQPVHVTGQLTLLTNQLPTGRLRIAGTNLSLARLPTLFLRGDLDLELSRTAGETPLITGRVQLTNTLYLPNLMDIVVDVTRPETRPPYFTVPDPPLASWRLDLKVQGDRFARVISPFFKGEVSANVRVTGTLKEPRVLGGATVDSGHLLFPFGAVQVENGRVSLTEENPFRPQIDLQGGGLNFGYHVRLDLDGPVDAPNLSVTSVPPLSSKEILLMLAAGEVPRESVQFSQIDKASRVGFYFGSRLVQDLIGLGAGPDRLTVRSGEEVNDRGGLSYSVEYKLSDRFSAIGIYDRFRNFNAGIKFRVLSR